MNRIRISSALLSSMVVALAQGQSPRPISDQEAVRLANVRVPVTLQDVTLLTQELEETLKASVKPVWRDRVLQVVHRQLAFPGAEWEKNALGFLRLRAGAVSATCFKGRLIRYELTPEWLDELGADGGELMTKTEAGAALRTALLKRVPSGWSVDPGLGGDVVDLNHAKFLQSFAWTPRYRGYDYAAGVGSHFAVDRVSGAVTEFWMNMAYLPNVRVEDAPPLTPARLAALRKEALRVYAQADPLAKGVAWPGGAQLMVPGLDYRLNEMTPRLRRRSAEREAVLVFVMAVYGTKSSGARTVQTVFVDAVTGRGIAVNEHPYEEASFGSGGWPSGSELKNVGWRIVGAEGRAFRISPAVSTGKRRRDRQALLQSSDGDLLCVDVDLDRRVLWDGERAWKLPQSDWASLVRSTSTVGRRFGQKASDSIGVR